MNKLACSVAQMALIAMLTGVVTAAPDFEALGRETVSELATGAFDKVVARFDQNMMAALPREKLESAWRTIVRTAGSFKSVTSVRIEPVPAKGVHVVWLRSAFENMPLNIQIAVNDEGRIAGLYFLSVIVPVAEWFAEPQVIADIAN